MHNRYHAVRKPSVPKTSARNRAGSSTSSASRTSRTFSCSPDNHSNARTDRSNGVLAVSLDGVGGVGMVLHPNDRYPLQQLAILRPKCAINKVGL